jgi:glycosyltransferase involved in cell wall biosynthesis
MELISFIVPAWNEEALLARALGAIHAAARDLPVPYEIIVVDDSSTDGTAHIARESGARVVSVQHRQISAVRNAGAREARGDVFFFVDADTVVYEEVIRAALHELRTGAVGGGCVFRFDGWVPPYARIVERITMAITSRLRLASGCFIFCTRKDFEAVGGFDIRLFAAEEWALSTALRGRGRFVILREKVSTSGRKVRAHSGRELLWFLVCLGLRGRKGLRDRRKLDLWYGDRREDSE